MILDPMTVDPHRFPCPASWSAAGEPSRIRSRASLIPWFLRWNGWWWWSSYCTAHVQWLQAEVKALRGSPYSARSAPAPTRRTPRRLRVTRASHVDKNQAELPF